MAFPQSKKPGMSVMVAVGKPKDGPSPLKRLDQQDKEPPTPQHEEPDADQAGGPSDNDADNRIGENIDLIQQHIPEAIHPIAGLIEAIANYCRGQKSEEAGEDGGGMNMSGY